MTGAFLGVSFGTISFLNFFQSTFFEEKFGTDSEWSQWDIYPVEFGKLYFQAQVKDPPED